MPRKRTKLPAGPYVIVEVSQEQEEYLQKVSMETGFTKEVLAGKLLAEGMKIGLQVKVEPMGDVA